MKDEIFGVLQRIGRSFMLPIALLPAAGLLLGIGGSLTNPTMQAAYQLEGLLGPGTALYSLLLIMTRAGDVVFGNLPIIFAMGVAIGMAKREKSVAALAAAISFFVMHASINALLNAQGNGAALSGATANVCGIQSLQMGVFGGIIVGLGASWLHNRFYNIQLPQFLSFFGGTRFVPIVCSLVFLFVGIGLFFLWPVVQSGITSASGLILSSGYPGTFVYGLIERLLIPFGLHHVFYLPIWQTSLGGTLEVGGKLVEGAQNIFFAQLGNTGVEHFSVEATRFMSGKFPFMIFGLPGAALAMYRAARPEKKNMVKGLLISAALTSILTGITEPIEFTFLFVAPALYYIHCILAGLSYMLMHMLSVGVGMTFSGGFIDLFLFGILQGNDKTGWLAMVPVGIVYFLLYYFIFSFAIRRWDLKTPGRGEDEEEVKLYTKADYQAKQAGAAAASVDERSRAICNGLGGKKNISDVDCCITRLRCTVYKPELVSQELLKSTGASGVLCKGSGVQVVYGPKVANIKSALEEYLLTAPEVEYHGPQSEAVPEEKPGSAAPVLLKQAGRVKKGEVVMLFPAAARAVPKAEELAAGATEFTHRIKDRLGIHARPAGELAKLAKGFDAAVTISCQGKTVPATSPVKLMSLGAGEGAELVVAASGAEAAQVIAALHKFMQDRL